MTGEFYDLHVHTTASDGTCAPDRLVEEAAALGLSGVAVTDHDTVAGVAPAAAAASGTRLTVVPGLELGAEHRGVEVHILGYYLDPRHAGLNGELERLRQARTARAGRIIERLAALGYPLEPEEVASQAKGDTVGRPHVAAALAVRGYVRDVDQAFAELLGRGRPAYVPRLRHTPVQAVRLIREAGGAAVLAHPGLYPQAAEELLPELAAAGLAGLEVYYPAHDAGTENLYRVWSRRLDLTATGGSDFHGPGRHGEAALGARGVSAAVLTELRARAGLA